MVLLLQEKREKENKKWRKKFRQQKLSENIPFKKKKKKKPSLRWPPFSSSWKPLALQHQPQLESKNQERKNRKTNGQSGTRNEKRNGEHENDNTASRHHHALHRNADERENNKRDIGGNQKVLVQTHFHEAAEARIHNSAHFRSRRNENDWMDLANWETRSIVVWSPQIASRSSSHWYVCFVFPCIRFSFLSKCDFPFLWKSPKTKFLHSHQIIFLS